MSDAASFALGLVGTALVIIAFFAVIGDALAPGLMLLALGCGAFVLAAKDR